MAKKATTKRKTPASVELADLDRAVKALNATQHNPIAWGPIIAYFGPIVARLAIRVGLTYLARKTGRKIAPKARQEVVDYTSTAILAVLKRLK